MFKSPIAEHWTAPLDPRAFRPPKMADKGDCGHCKSALMTDPGLYWGASCGDMGLLGDMCSAGTDTGRIYSGLWPILPLAAIRRTHDFFVWRGRAKLYPRQGDTKPVTRVLAAIMRKIAHLV